MLDKIFNFLDKNGGNNLRNLSIYNAYKVEHEAQKVAHRKPEWTVETFDEMITLWGAFRSLCQRNDIQTMPEYWQEVYAGRDMGLEHKTALDETSRRIETRKNGERYEICDCLILFYSTGRVVNNYEIDWIDSYG